ncbi:MULTISPECIES: hypothetical protein [Geobacillus]|uniref:Uncharacterized protein n=2 Tax=Geobacillus thermodenitrificans TaxID=33940 RepID=A4IN90_GEOTN|nr:MULTISPECIES: hypothetical protein [Geobacillus]ABO66794.1 Conserved hypothetical protein [Geobacillus thermodenitrificans NG80-2]ARP42560.1 hypothetical protein GTHT12_01004 [Geobacillus thermodenitrificans]KQB93500.1 hypothetical protein GEPA3_1499 [Geobacillus sp. PA-3]MEC5186454.1 hypothetical protein [Geobacillus thermodenitrificans]MED3718157.1 hypothetical protein [Geobacillus thermodenitrificans]
MENQNQRRDNRMVAPGIDDDEELNEKATKEEIERGDYTRVVTLAWDEVEPSEPR